MVLPRGPGWRSSAWRAGNSFLAPYPVEYLSLGGTGPRHPCARRCALGTRLASISTRRAPRQSQPRSSSLRRPEGPAAPRPVDLRALITLLDRGQGSPGIGGHSSRRQSACCCAASSGSKVRRRQRVLRRAAARHRRSDPNAPDGRGVISASGCSGSGQAAPLLDGAHLARRRRLGVPRGRWPDNPARVLLRRSAPALQRRPPAFSGSHAGRAPAPRGASPCSSWRVPGDVVSEGLGQLSTCRRSAARLRRRRMALKLAFHPPDSDFYEIEGLLTQMSIGEAAVTILSELEVSGRIVQRVAHAPAVPSGARRPPRRSQGVPRTPNSHRREARSWPRRMA